MFFSIFERHQFPLRHFLLLPPPSPLLSTPPPPLLIPRPLLAANPPPPPFKIPPPPQFAISSTGSALHDSISTLASSSNRFLPSLPPSTLSTSPTVDFLGEILTNKEASLIRGSKMKKKIHFLRPTEGVTVGVY